MTMRSYSQLLAEFPLAPFINYMEHPNDPEWKHEGLLKTSGYIYTKNFTRVVAQLKGSKDYTPEPVHAGAGFFVMPWWRTCSAQVLAAPYVLVSTINNAWEGGGTIQPGKLGRPKGSKDPSFFDLRPFGEFKNADEVRKYMMLSTAFAALSTYFSGRNMGPKATWMTYRNNSGTMQDLIKTLQAVIELYQEGIPHVHTLQFHGLRFSPEAASVKTLMQTASNVRSLYPVMTCVPAYAGVSVAILDSTSTRRVGWKSRPDLYSQTPRLHDAYGTVNVKRYEEFLKAKEVQPPTEEFVKSSESVYECPPTSIWPHY